MESLPVELNCDILGRLTSPDDIIRLFKTNIYLADIARDCITRLAWKDGSDRTVPLTFVSEFPNLQYIESPVSYDNASDLLALNRLKRLRSVNIYYPSLDLLDKIHAYVWNYQDIRQMFIDDLTKISAVYLELNPNIETIRLVYPAKSMSITVRKGSLTFNLQGDAYYQELDPLMRVIDKRDGLVTLSHTSQYQAVIQKLGRDFPALKNLVYLQGPLDNINDYLRFTNIDSILINDWNSNDISWNAAVFDLTVTNYLEYGWVRVDKPINLELPISLKNVPTLLDLYPNLETLAIYQDGFRDNDLNAIWNLTRQGRRVIVYTNEREANKLTGISNVIVRYI